MEVTLQTPRLVLKSVTPALIRDFFTKQDKQAIMDFFGCDETGYESLKEKHEKGMETHRLSLFYFLIVSKETNRTIGECGFHTWKQSHNRAELFYMLRADSDKRKGYVSEALPVVLDYGFNELQLHRIEAFVASWNVPSVKLLVKSGFTKEATLREHYLHEGKYEDSDCYSLLKPEWNP
jgi:ribosomal-protein-alanine N-acetyltransferase